MHHGVVHHVADHVDAVGDALAGEVLSRPLRGAEEHAGDVIDQHAVDFFRHPAVAAAHAGLHVGDGNPQLDRRQRPGERGIRVAVDEHGVRLPRAEFPLDPHEHRRGGLAVTVARPGLEIHDWRRDFHLVEEDLAHHAVIMLARMEYLLVDRRGRGSLVVGGDRPTERRSLDELRSCPDDGQQSQSSFGGHGTSLSDVRIFRFQRQL